MQTVAFLGMGVMGSAMAGNLAQGGYRVYVWNRNPQRPEIKRATDRGAIWCDSIPTAVNKAEIVFICVGDGADVEQVLFPHVVDHLSPGGVVVDCSTIGVPAAQKIAAELATYDLEFCDAPVSGGDIGAQEGTLTFMVGGKPETYERILPLLQVMGKNIFYCGAVGSGQAVKLCNQVLVSHYMMGICEAMTLAQKLNISPELVVEVCGSGAAASWALTNLGMKVATGDFAPGFMIKHMLKDLHLVAEAKGDLHLPGTDLVTTLFEHVCHLADGAEQGTQAMVRFYGK
ncbi:MAG: NAD(P)-dependent oxidoreductase [Pseudanabaenaceae cyanobacterium SKYGB_i_bin29]|nr:NAD(P)-dependent oxidoreductase [Pseudanabaenaceae cyanobacterium SKYG29]MDW8421433.1 NAD(P)-dependent oxidoreductase [Pseudanabaenaceae cyanobacterium SKYGB_i_bin29]